MRNRALANLLAKGPKGVAVRARSTTRERYFELIAQVARRVPERSFEVWSVYARGRGARHLVTTRGGCLVWHAVWDTARDLKERPWNEGRGPAVTAEVKIVPPGACGSVAASLQMLDNALVSGVPLTRRASRAPSGWFELSLSRTQDDSGFSMFWSSYLANERCEAAAGELTRAIMQAATAGHRRAASVRMQFDWSPYLDTASDGSSAPRSRTLATNTTGD